MDGHDLGRSVASTLDRAVHITLPPDAGVLAREEQSTARSGQPRSKVRGERRVEEGIATASVRVMFPPDLMRGDQIGAARPEPIERSCQPARTFLRNDLLSGITRA